MKSPIETKLRDELRRGYPGIALYDMTQMPNRISLARTDSGIVVDIEELERDVSEFTIDQEIATCSSWASRQPDSQAARSFTAPRVARLTFGGIVKVFDQRETALQYAYRRGVDFGQRSATPNNLRKML